MSWVSGIPCPKCGEDPLHVDKVDKLKEWALVCTSPGWLGHPFCGHNLGPGSYWLSNGPNIEEEWKKHCDSLGWDYEGNSK